MTELRPLLKSNDDEFELALLRSADRDEPSGSGKLRVAAALGLGVSAAAGTLAAASTAGVGGISGVSGVTSATAKVGLSTVLKSLAVGTAAGLITLGALNQAGFLADAPAPPGAPPIAAPLPAKPGGPALAATPVPASEPAAEPSVAAEQLVVQARAAGVFRSPLRAPAGAAPEVPTSEPLVEPAPEPVRAASIAGEIAEIDRIRAALRQGRAVQSLADLERYFQSSPTRVLETEASILRIDALVASGQRARAATLAREFLTRQPMSRHAERLRQLAGTGEAAAAPSRE